MSYKAFQQLVFIEKMTKQMTVLHFLYQYVHVLFCHIVCTVHLRYFHQVSVHMCDFIVVNMSYRGARTGSDQTPRALRAI